MSSVNQQLSNYYFNAFGWNTKKHIIVIESDDWGSIRMPSKEVYNKLLNAGIRVDNCNYCRYDSIETEHDLSRLFEVLTSVKDKNEDYAVLTANTLVANPDFQKIKESGFSNYYYKKISEYFEERDSNIINLFKQGKDNRCFVLQSHGREHVNVSHWMNFLKVGYKETRLAFDLGVFGISTTITSENRKSFLSAFDFENAVEEKAVNEIAVDGLNIFEEIYGYKSKTFIAPNYTWGTSLEKVLKEQGVEYLQGGKSHSYSLGNGQKGKRKIRHIGSKNKNGQINLSRNVHFEPSKNKDYDWVNSCLQNINTAFRWGKPAIISSHRVNYMGSLDVTNRDNSLKMLKHLLQSIIQKWPDVEFMTTESLGDLIKYNIKK